MIVEDPADRILKLIASSESRIQRAFVQAVKDAKDDIVLTRIADLLERGSMEEALRVVDSITSVMSTQISLSVVESGESTATFISNVLGSKVLFDNTNVRAISIMRQASLDLIREFTQQQTDATREALTEGIRRQLNPIDQARAFRDSIGLTQRQQQAVNNFRRLLEENPNEALTRQLRDRRFDPSVIRSISIEEPLSKEHIDRMVTRYRERYIQYRSRVIARTESLRAVHQGTEEMYRQAIESGDLEASQLTRAWDASGDANVRNSHSLMDGQVKPFGEAFISGAGNLLRYPGDPNAPGSDTIQCRCVLTTRLEI